jgi:hypothetical protein
MLTRNQIIPDRTYRQNIDPYDNGRKLVEISTESGIRTVVLAPPAGPTDPCDLAELILTMEDFRQNWHLVPR